MDRLKIINKIDWGDFEWGKRGSSGAIEKDYSIYYSLRETLNGLTQKSPFPPLSKNRDIYINIPTIHRRGRRQSITI